MKKKDRMTLLIAESLRKMKSDAGLTQKQIADILKVDRSTIGYYLNGDRKIYIDTFIEFCGACGKDHFEELDKVLDKYRKTK